MFLSCAMYQEYIPTLIVQRIQPASPREVNECHERLYPSPFCVKVTRYHVYLQRSPVWVELHLLGIYSADQCKNIQDFMTSPFHSLQKIESFDANFDEFKKMAGLMDPDSSIERLRELSEGGYLNDSADFDYPCLMAVRLRASQKQVLWDVIMFILERDGLK